MVLYDLTKQFLETMPETRDSDKKLIWCIWEELGYVTDGKLVFSDFINPNCPTPESVTRARRKVQENHPNLQASEGVLHERREKEKSKGTFVYREQVSVEKPSYNKEYEKYIGKDGREYWREK